jgi:hypothetical protein
MTTKRERLEKQILYAERALATKRAAMAKHAPGTPWHTRAKRDAEAIEARIAWLRGKLDATQ